MVSQSVITMMIVSGIVAILVPIILVIFGVVKLKVKMKPVTLGIVTFIVFAVILEQVVHAFVTRTSVWEYPAFRIPYSALMAGIFEEGGRFLVMTYLLKKFRDWKDGFAFGLGHGGIESILILGLSSFSNIFIAFQINSGNFDKMMTPQTKDALMMTKKAILNITVFDLSLASIERLCALALQIALAIFVMYAVKSGKLSYLFYAIGIHALCDLPAAFYQTGYLSLVPVEIMLIVIAVGSVWYIIKSKNTFKKTSSL
ncbi:putative chaperone [Fictibacillus macauensis ZFHKF-1]|uniref:Putative chaperone n=1 Tax=Fictibacillus macauensis ZFHKF-1 TaxID=1196324 RepID=I8J2T2_9BACL|nr:YhfC family glutamic-type intramembrane protease [Fictibacillus macauensis]EIT86056.1 putative chaperone [Fictibacillus macauensis ZFHKF-1]